MRARLIQRAGLLVLFVLTAPLNLQAEDKSSGAESTTIQKPQDTPTSKQLHDELRALKKTMEQALNSMDIDTIAANVTEDIVFTTMNGDLVRGRDGVRQYFEKMMKGPNRRVETVNTKFEVGDVANIYGNNFATAFGTSKDHYSLAGGDDFDVNARWSTTMIRQNGKWQVANFHYSTNMFDNPVLDKQRNMISVGAISICLVLAVLAFFLGRKTAKRVS